MGQGFAAPKGYPDTVDFQGFNAPVRMEWSVQNLPVEGSIPAEIDGAFFRAIADPAQVPFIPDDTMLSGDGMISRFRIQGNHVDFAIRYVETERYLAEKAARRALFGAYRNPYTDDPLATGVDRGVANTTPIWHAGRLFMTKEDARAWEIDPETLETLGKWDYHGALKSETMTAHARIDPDTGEMFFFGYEAGGLATKDIAYCIADKDGELVSEQWFQAPYCAMIHDFAVTRTHAIFPIFPTTADLDRLKAGGPHWVHEQDQPCWVGIMPRYGKVEQMRWFKGPEGHSAFHVMNAYDDGDRVHMDLALTDTNVFPFIRAASGIERGPGEIKGALTRWTFDMAGSGDGFEQQALGPLGDMPRIADKDQGRPYRVGYYGTYDPRIGPPLVHGVVGTGFNCLLRIEVGNGRIEALALAPDQSISEPIHIPARDPGHEGWLAAIVDTHSDMSSALWILEAETPGKGAIAKVPLPMRLRPQVHGWWVGAEQLKARAAAA